LAGGLSVVARAGLRQRGLVVVFRGRRAAPPGQRCDRPRPYRSVVHDRHGLGDHRICTRRRARTGKRGTAAR